MTITIVDDRGREVPASAVPTVVDARGRETPIATITQTDASGREIQIYMRPGGLIRSVASPYVASAAELTNYLSDIFALTVNADNATSSSEWPAWRNRISTEMDVNYIRAVREAVAGPTASGGSWTIPDWLTDMLDSDTCPWMTGKTLMLQLNMWGVTLGTPNFGGKRITFSAFRASDYATNVRYRVWKIFQDIPASRVNNIAVSNEPENFPLPGSYEKWVPDYADDRMAPSGTATLAATTGSNVTLTLSVSQLTANDVGGEIRAGRGFGAIVGYVSPTQVLVTNFGAFSTTSFASGAWSIAGRGAISSTLTLGSSAVQSGGTTHTVTAGSAVFSASDVGSYIFGGKGRATIASYTSGTVAKVNILEPFAATSLASGGWHTLGQRSPNGILDAMDRLIRTLYICKEQVEGINCPAGMVNGNLNVAVMGPLIARPAGAAIQYGTYSQRQLYLHDAGINGPGDLADSVHFLSDHQHNVNTRVTAWDGSWTYAVGGDLSMYHSVQSKIAMNAARVASGRSAMALLLANDEAGIALSGNSTTNYWAGQLQEVGGSGAATILSVSSDGNTAQVLVTTAFSAASLSSAQWKIPSYVDSPSTSLTLSGTATGIRKITTTGGVLPQSLADNIEALCSYKYGPHLLGLSFWGVFLWCAYALGLSAATTDFNYLENFGWTGTWPSRNTWTFLKNYLLDYRLYDIGATGSKELMGVDKPWTQFNRLYNGCVLAAVSIAPTATPASGSAPFAEWRRVTMTAAETTMTAASGSRNLVGFLVLLRHKVKHRITCQVALTSGGAAAKCAVRARGYDRGDQAAEAVQIVSGPSTDYQDVTVEFTPAFGLDVPKQGQAPAVLICVDHNGTGTCKFKSLKITEVAE